jgi:hypothetical protein
VPYQPRATYDNPYGPQVSFRTLDVLPPAAYYVDLNDRIIFKAFTDVASASLMLVVRILSPQGVVTVETLTLINSQPGSQQVSGQLTGFEGYILSACVTAPGISPGRAYCLVSLQRTPALANALTTALLAAGYASDKYPLSYPTMQPRAAGEGAGQLVLQTTTVPATTEWQFRVPAGTRWRVNYGTFTLVTSALAGSRVPLVAFYDSTGPQIGMAFPPAGQPASTNYTYSFVPGGAAVSNGTLQQISGPADLLLDSGDAIQSFTVGIETGDQYSAIYLQVQEWVGV